MNGHRHDGFATAKRKAEALAQDLSEVSQLIRGAVAKAGLNRHTIQKFSEALDLVIRMLKAWTSGRYTAAPYRSLIFATAAIVYFVNPFDMVPDFVPGVGFLDDAMVLAFVIGSIKKDLDDFRKWEDQVQNKKLIKVTA